MNMRHAMRINRALVSYAVAHLMDCSDYISDAETFLRGVSLLDMAAATELVSNARGVGISNEDGSTSMIFFTKCDPRIVAAIYAMLHFPAEKPGQPEPILVGYRCALFSIVVPWPPRPGEEDNTDD